MRTRLSLSLLACLLTTALFGCEEEAEQPTETAESAGVAVKVPADGRVTVKVDEYGYKPATIEVPAGKPLHLLFIRTTDKGCGGEVVFPERDIHETLPVGQEVPITFTPEKAGRIAFTCGMGMYEGAIIVSEGP